MQDIVSLVHVRPIRGNISPHPFVYMIQSNWIVDSAVMVWTATTDDVRAQRWAACAGWLNRAEQERQARLKMEPDRVAFAAVHALLHWALERVAGVPRDRQVFVTNAFGRPQLAPLAGRMEAWPSFSISHSRGLVAVAIGPCPSIGIDVERIDARCIDPLPLAQSAFDPLEADWVAGATQPELRCERFFRLWTIKEALVKAVGRGLALPLNSFAVQAEPPRIEICPFDLRPDGHWRVEQWRPDERSWAALAVDEAIDRPFKVKRIHLESEELIELLEKHL